MFTNFDKFFSSLLPLATILGGYFGFEVTPEWWMALAAVISPIAVFAFPMKKGA